jgi:superfamily II DNA or RNA helicase
MSFTELTEAYLAKIAGSDALQSARALVSAGKVLNSTWTPPALKGIVAEGTNSYRAGLVIQDTINIENLCSCRTSRDAGMICAHSVAVGLHHLLRGKRPPARPSVGPPEPPLEAGPRLRRAVSGERAETAEISVSFPTPFSAAVQRGKIMVRFEVTCAGRRVPLSALPMTKPFRLSAEDIRLLDMAEQLAGGETPGGLLLTTIELTQLLGALAGHPRLSMGRGQPLSVSSCPWRLPIHATLETSGQIRLNLPPDLEPPLLIVGETVWALRETSLELLALPAQWHSLLGGPVTLSRQRVPLFLSQELAVLEAECEVDANFVLEEFTLEPQQPRFLLALEGGLTQLRAHLQCSYAGRALTAGVSAKDEALWLPDPKSTTRYSTRDFAAENAATERMRRAGFTGPDLEGIWNLHGETQVVNFFAREFPRWQQEWELTLEARLERSAVQTFERIAPRLEITSSGDHWFDLELSLRSADGERFSAADIQRLILSGSGHARLKNGRIALIDTRALEEFNEVLRDCAPQQHEKGYRLNDVQAGFLDATLRQQPGWQVQASAQWRERAARQSGQATLECPPLGNLDDVLRPYQKQGVAWMRFLRENRFGGILADEMGLGKTLQTLAFLNSCRAEGKLAKPALIVCPTSLVFNWVAEAQKFTPELRVLALQGAERHALFPRISKSDLVVTSYALIRRDAERYRDLEFDTLVLDEAQHIKNRQTQNAAAVKAVRTKHRLVLTDTPMENSVLDLWSIFDFLMPGYLGGAQEFRDRYEQPITRNKDLAVQARLGRRLRPFILRRLKREVARDLPAKLEQVSFCELTEDQEQVYQQVLAVSRKEVLAAVGAQGLAKSRMIVLNALLRLRQICCDLRLLKLDEGNFTDASSGKLELFGELLEQAIDGRHRILVFSQFVSMLALLKSKLDADKIDFCYLDGSTTNRGAVVERFQASANIPVFLISLKAGGVGLNLTGADTVIHFDPWWNPAVEDQATDRAHRIGQTRVVTSYKLITRGTVEEKILALQQRKRAVIKATLGGEESVVENLTWEEIQSLFE